MLNCFDRQAPIRPRFRRLLLLLLFVMAGGRAPALELRWDAVHDQVSADLLDVPLRHVLERIRVSTGWEVAVEPGLNPAVSTTFSELASGKALERLLRGVNFALIQHPDRAAKLLVFTTSKERATQPVLETTEEETGDSRLEDEWIVTLKPGTDPEAVAAKLGAEIVGRIDELNAYRLRFESAEAAEAAKKLLAEDDSVEQIAENYAINRPDMAQPMGSAGSPLPPIRPGGEGNGGLIIGVVDTAVQLPAGELANFFLPTISISGEFQPTGSEPTHGTGMSSDILNAIAAMVGQGSSVHAAILPVDVFGASDSTSTFQLGQGMVEAWNNGATLINGSIGSKEDSAWLNAIIDRLTGYGAMIVAPSGNFPDGLPTFPAANPNVLAVTAMGPDGRLAPYANMAPFVDVAMPGTSIVSLTGSPYFMSGTSIATARATGAIAGYMLRTGEPLMNGRNFLLQTRGVGAGAQISP